MSRQPLGEGALARAVRAHDRVHLARVHHEVDTLQDLAAFDGRVQIPNLEQHVFPFAFPLARHPTLPSSLMPSSRCASTANSIGSSLKTSLQNPLTIIETASSAHNPRCCASKIWSSPIFEVRASCAMAAVLWRTPTYGRVRA